MGGDGDALDALVLCSSLPTGTVIEVIPIAVFKLLDNGETDYKILAVPKDNTLRTIQAKTLENLNTKYPKVKEIVALWFLNYNSKDTAQNLGWGNEEEALLEVKKNFLVDLHFYQALLQYDMTVIVKELSLIKV